MSQPETLTPPVAPEPEFQVLGATGRRHAAVPALDFDVHVTEPGGRQVHAIALSAQIMIEPARRTYDAETRAKLVELFGPPERWATTTRSLVWHQADVLVPAFIGSTTFRVAVPASFDMEVASSKYLYGLPDGELPLAFNFNGTVHYRGDDGRLQMSLVPWSCTAEFRMPVSIWSDLIEHYYPRSGWIPLHERTLQALQREKARRGLPTLDATRGGAARPVNELVESLLYEGYALYPYTPGRPRTPRPRRSGSSTRPRTRASSTPPTTTWTSSASSRVRTRA